MIDDNGRVIEDDVRVSEDASDDGGDDDGDKNRDTNNNVAGEDRPSRSRVTRTYGLRPRTLIRRPLIDRSPSDENRTTPPPKGRPRLRTQPLSKYRRKTANARERHRMKEINDAFAALRGILPPFTSRKTSNANPTKITTLKLAASYIKALADLLKETEPPKGSSEKPAEDLPSPAKKAKLEDSRKSEDPSNTAPSRAGWQPTGAAQKDGFEASAAATEPELNLLMSQGSECDLEEVWDDLTPLPDFCWTFV